MGPASSSRDNARALSQANVDLFWLGIKAFNDRDVDSLDEWITEDFEFVPYLATLIETSTYRGHDGLRKYLEDADAAWKSFHVSVEEVRDLGDRVLAFGEIRGRGRRSGLEVRVPLAWLVEFQQGKLRRNRAFPDRSEALEAAGIKG